MRKECLSVSALIEGGSHDGKVSKQGIMIGEVLGNVTAAILRSWFDALISSFDPT